MVTFALRIGNHDFGFPTASPLHSVFILTLTICAFAILGAVIGFIFRRQIVLQVLLSVLTSSSVVLYFVAREGWLSSKYSLQQKIDGLQEVARVYVLFCIAPTVLASIFVARWFLRRQTI